MDRTPGLLFLICLVVRILVVEGFEQAEEVNLEARFVTPASSSTSSIANTGLAAAATTQPYFQPALIGFRCEGTSEQTLDGVSVIESNAPVKITLFGEAFTTNTIVAFTTELVRDPDIVDQVISSNQINAQVTPASRLQFEPSSTATSSSEIATATNTQIPKSTSWGDGGVSLRASQSQHRAAKKFERRLLGKNYDCTDYDRVISYKLNEDNIITPNVAVLTIRLPELDETSSGPYYYFCLKQPPVPSSQLPGIYQASSSATPHEHATLGDNSLVHGPLVVSPERSSLSNHTNGNQQQQLVWVHQGDEWWLALKVEPPILSVANDCILIVLLLFLSAVTSGLNLGLMSLDMNELAVISSCGDQRERSYARTIAPLRKRGNYLLCSLLLGNVMVNSTLTVILEEMTSGVVAVIGSTLAIVVLGEIVPQAFCARQGLAIGAKTIYLTYAFMIITFPLSYPISCLLDCILGEERGNVYDRERLMEFIRITGNHTQLEADEVAIISGALKLKKIRVDQIMTRIEDVFMLPIDCMLNRETIKSIIEKGYSRIPVYEFGDRKQIVALILAKDLALLDPDDQVPLASMLMYCKHPLIFIEDTATLDVALNEFKTGKSHMAIVRQIYDDGEVDKYYEAIGVVTLEDVIEEVLQTEINDETDTLSDNRRKRRRMDAQVAHLVDNLAQQQPALPGPTPAPKF